jgi:RNA recognition motif-containing protein
MMESGKMSKLDYERAKIIEDELMTLNRGYCFLTFSHADEARTMLMERGNSLTYMEYQKLTFHLKSRIDHSDLDPEYFAKRARNNAKIVDELKKVRETRQELRDFENNLDNELPSRKKLKAMKNLAKEVIEDPKYHTRQSAST